MANKTSKSQEGYYARYKANKVWETNRKKRLARALKQQPNNLQIKAAMGGMVYRRKTPTTRVWSASWVRIAKLFKEIEGRFDPDIMSANQEIVRAAMMRQSKVSAEIVKQKNKPEVMRADKFFKLETRLQGIK